MEQNPKPKHPGGRPRLGALKMIVRSIRLSPDDWQWLDENGGPGEFIREAIRKARARQRRNRIDE